MKRLVSDDTDPRDVCPRCRRCVVYRSLNDKSESACSDPDCAWWSLSDMSRKVLHHG